MIRFAKIALSYFIGEPTDIFFKYIHGSYFY